MDIDTIEAPSANINLPLNRSVQQANGAQFALMLSLIMESKSSVSNVMGAAVLPHQGGIVEVPPASDFNIETTQSQSLQLNQVAHFNLLRSLYEERTIPVDRSLLVKQQAPQITDQVLQQIEQGQSSAVFGAEARKVHLAA